MTVKHELIRILEEAMDFEEKSIPLLHDRCLACFQEIEKSGIIQEDKRKMHKMLNELVAGSREHLVELEEILKKVKESRENEF